jgi:hypothetical protein
LKGFEGAGKRAYPEINEEDFVKAVIRIEEFQGEVEGDTAKMSKLSEDEKKEFEKTINSDINWTSSRLFFDEPTNNQKFYAEFYALFNNVKKNKDGTFTCQIENNIDKYVYENKKLVRVIKKNPIKNIELRFISEKVITDSGI